MQAYSLGPFEIRDAVRSVMNAVGRLEGDLNSQRLIWHLKNNYGIDIRNIMSPEALNQFEISLNDVFGKNAEPLIGILYKELDG